MQDPQVELLGKTVLVHAELPREESQEDLQELVRLAQSAGAEVADSIICKRETPDPAFFIGSGKAQEVASSVAAYEAETVIFNSRLSPAHERNLEKVLKARVMDRIALILLIFAQRARTYEGKLQVELARLQYEQARLVRGWTHLERQKGGFGLRGGPGETQIELDRRALRERIAAVKGELLIVERRRNQNRALRKKNSIPVVSFAGYTNAGKSTLFNILTDSKVYAADQLFATLDPTLRTVEVVGVGKAVFADTVGFIRHLPHDLIAAFKSTLEETAQASLILHVIDTVDPRRNENIDAVNEVLKEVGASEVPSLLVFNKCDLDPDCVAGVIRDENGVPMRVYVSAKTGAGLEDLLLAVSERLGSERIEFTVKIDPRDGRLRSLLYEKKTVVTEKYSEQGENILQLKIRPQDAARIDKETQGALARSSMSGIPWKKDTDFDFDSL